MSDETNTPDPPHKAGYGNPPIHTQFGKGKSGNPKGRPKGSKNFATAFRSELNSRIHITENGKRKKISKREAIAKNLANKAVTGDARALPLALNEIRLREGLNPEAVADIDQTPAKHDQMVIEGILQRIRRGHAADTPVGNIDIETAAEPDKKEDGDVPDNG